MEEALSHGQSTIPVLYVDLSEDEERLVLASLDPLAAMATTDEAKLRELLAEVSAAATRPGDRTRRAQEPAMPPEAMRAERIALMLKTYAADYPLAFAALVMAILPTIVDRMLLRRFITDAGAGA